MLSLEGTHLIVGLGNPGSRYEKSRHNAGFMVIDNVALAFGIPLNSKKYDNRFGRGAIEIHDVILAKPMAYMNNSGPSVQKLLRFFKLQSQNMLVIHDDIDLSYGRIKLMEKGGHGGHKGIQSLISALGDNHFPRLRIGVGRPDTKNGVIDHVLGSFTSTEEQILEKIIEKARECVALFLNKGITEGMNQVNNRKLLIEY
jgi:PTH1 family peptidyl-tRNA hydrolase